MPGRQFALVEPLFQEAAPCTVRCARKGLALISLLIGVGVGIFLSSLPYAQKRVAAQTPVIDMASQHMQPARAWRYMQPTMTWRYMQPVKMCGHTEHARLQSLAAGARPELVVASSVAEEAPPAIDSGNAGFVTSYSSAVGGRSVVARVLSDGAELIGQRITVCGWVKTLREAMKGAVMFLEVNDGSCQRSLQVVVDKEARGFESVLNGGGTGSSVKCTGVMVKSEGGKQAFELLVKEADDEVELLGGIDNPKEYPMAKGRPSIEFLRQQAHLRPRSNLIGSVARVRSALALATHDFFRSKGFLYVHTPLITSSDCEGAGEMFQVTTLLDDAAKGELPLDDKKQIDYSKDFFAKPSYLTVSGQISVEPYCCSLSNVYTFGPTFRAENSQTTRHLAEFWMIEPELAFADIFDDMQCAEDYLKSCVKYVMEHNMEDLEFFNLRIEKGLIDRLKNLLAEPFARVSYTEAIDMLKNEESKAKFEKPVEWGMDLGSEHERWLVEKITLKPTIVYNYPKDIKAFYMRVNDDNKTVAAMDMLVPRIGEVIGGSQREERLDVLDRRMVEMNLDPKEYWWYRDLRRFGSVPHSGFGLGFERLIMLCTGVENIRDVIPYPRYPDHNTF